MTAQSDPQLGMPADLFDAVTELVADREAEENDHYSDYDFAHAVARMAYATGELDALLESAQYVYDEMLGQPIEARIKARAILKAEALRREAVEHPHEEHR